MDSRNEVIISTLEDNDFGVYVESDYVDIETWTDGGVNMIASFNLESLYEDLTDYIECFDVDDEVDFHRQIDEYKNDFTNEESLADFRAFKERLDELQSEIEVRLNSI